MKPLVVAVFVVVALVVIAFVPLHLRLDRLEHKVPAEPAPRPEAPSPSVVEASNADLDELRGRIEALEKLLAERPNGAPAQEPVAAPAPAPTGGVSWKDLQSQQFRERLRAPVMAVILEDRERRAGLVAAATIPGYAKSMMDRWPLPEAFHEDFEAFLTEWRKRGRALWLEYSPDGQALDESDPRYAEWEQKGNALWSWVEVQLRGFYGPELPNNLLSLLSSLMDSLIRPTP